MIRDTSLEAYQSILGDITNRQMAVLRCLLKSPKTNKQISEILERPINEITPRVGELVKKGLVKAIGKVKDKITNKSVTVWAVNE